MMSISADGSTGNVGSVTSTEPPPTPTKIEPVNPGTTSSTTKTEPAKTEPVKTEPAKTEPATTSTPAPVVGADGFEYRIQIAASASDPGKSKYANLGSKLYIVKEDNMYKVQYGKYASKEEAQKGKDEVLAKGYTPYLVKYKDNVRIK
jgi:hypothetical protein